MQPNIIYLHTHDTGRHIQPYGYNVATPNLQRLAEQGVLFRQAFCCGPTCGPSRAALVTGQNPHTCGMLGLPNLGWRLKDMGRHLARTLKASGYYTALSGTQHITNDTNEIGYDAILHEGVRTHHDFLPRALGFLKNPPKDKPFFLSIGHWRTHRHMYEGIDPRDDPRYLQPPAVAPDTPEVREDYARFCSSARRMDEDWGRVLGMLDETGLAENTLIIATTDHGIGWPRMKCTLFDGGLGVMLIMRGPGGFTGGQCIDSLVSHLDIYPTLCDLLDIEGPGGLEGKSLLPLVNGQDERIHDEIYGEITWHVSYQPERCVRTERYKYIRRFDDRPQPPQPNVDDGPSKQLWQDHGWGEQQRPAEALYDLTFDPTEACNVIDRPEYADVAADLRARLDAWMKRTDDPLLDGPVDIPAGQGGKFVPAEQISSDGPWVNVE